MGCYKKIIIILSIICIVLCFSLHAYAQSVSPFGYGSMSLIPDKYSDYANTNKFVILSSVNPEMPNGVFLFKKFTDKPSFTVDDYNNFRASTKGLFVPIKYLSYENNNINFPVLDWDNATEVQNVMNGTWQATLRYYNSPDVINNTTSVNAHWFVPLINAYQDFMPATAWHEHTNDFWAYEYIEIKNRIFWHSADKPLYFITNNRDMPVNDETSVSLDVIFQSKNGSTDIVSDYDLGSNNYQLPITDEFFNACKNLAKGDNNIIQFKIFNRSNRYWDGDWHLDAYIFSVYVKESDFNGGYNPEKPYEPTFTNANGKTTGTIENGVINATTDYSAVTNSMQETTNAVKDGTTAIQNTLTDNNTNNISNNDLVTDNTQDITENGFSNIFNTLYNAFTSYSSKDVVVPVPYTNKSFTISKASIFGGFTELSWLENLSSAFWYFIISLFIVKDISKRFNKIKSGDIEHVVDCNVKEDLL